MDVYKIKIYPTAKKDLQEIIDYLNTLSQQAALRYYDLLIAEIESLSQMPFRCPKPRDIALAAKGYRYLIVENYLVFYVVARDTVQIRRIFVRQAELCAALLDDINIIRICAAGMDCHSRGVSQPVISVEDLLGERNDDAACDGQNADLRAGTDRAT